MKPLFFIIAFGIALSPPVPALAEFHSLSASYLHSFIKIKTSGTEADAGALDGINVKYRYEWGGPLSLIGSLSYMTANAYSRQVSENSFQKDARYRYSAISLTAGPAWRFNEYVSLYGIIGVNYDDYSLHASKTAIKAGTSTATQHYRDQRQKAALAYGAGVQINPVQHRVVDLGYEASRFDHRGLTFSRNALLFGVGYRF